MVYRILKVIPVNDESWRGTAQKYDFAGPPFRPVPVVHKHGTQFEKTDRRYALGNGSGQFLLVLTSGTLQPDLAFSISCSKNEQVTRIDMVMPASKPNVHLKTQAVHILHCR
jgi:hypothetical protein